MRQFIVVMCCCLTLSASGKGNSTSNLPQSCQNVFKRWDELIVKLESNSNIPKIMCKLKKVAALLCSMRFKKLKLLSVRECASFQGVLWKKLQALASDPQGLDNHIRVLEQQYK